MIYTITLNPALDHFLDVDDLRVDDANRVKGECLYAGGLARLEVSRKSGGTAAEIGLEMAVLRLGTRCCGVRKRSFRARSAASGRDPRRFAPPRKLRFRTPHACLIIASCSTA